MYSASQVVTYLQCQRKWGWKYLDGIKSEAHPSALKGSKVHEWLERYLTDGTIDFGTTPEEQEIAEIAIAGISFLPPPGTVRVEEQFWLELSDGADTLAFTGLIDAQDDLQIYDHKTTSNLRWAKTQDELQHDPQALIYAIARLLSGGSEVKGTWVYYQTKGTRVATSVPFTITREHAFRMAGAIFSVVKEMHDHKKNERKALALLPSAGACGDYGGCPYQSHCSLTVAQRLKGGSMTIVEQLLSRTGPVVTAQAINPPEFKLIENPNLSSTGSNPTPACEVLVDTDTPPPPAVDKAEAKTPKTKRKAPTPAKTLYVQCAPDSETTRLSGILAAANRKVSEANGVGDYSYIPYGKGAGAMREALRELLAPCTELVATAREYEAFSEVFEGFSIVRAFV